MEKCGSFSCSKKRGFALAEVVVAIFIATIALALVAGLGQQVMDLSKRSTQTGTVLELRSMVNSITRNPTTWIEKMRGSVNLKGLYAGCIPDPKLNIGTFSCPAIDAGILSRDLELAKIAGSNFHVSSVPMINTSGDLIAGTLDEPVMLTSEGRVCTTNNCAFKSTGFFLRSNANNASDPGSVKFVVKVERNRTSVDGNTAPMKAQYMSIDIGEEWKSFDPLVGGVCPAGSVKVGYLSNGQPSCINPSKKCTGAGQYAIGTDNAGNTICKTLPASCPAGSGYTLNATGTDLVCSSSESNPCGASNLFLGYYGGSGEPMCTGADIKCAEGQVQVGVSVAGGKIAAECAAIPATCADANNRLTYDGEKFVCKSAAVAVTCGENQTMSGMRADGTPMCVETKRLPASNNNCGPGTVAASIDSNGAVICRGIVSADFRGLGSCPGGYALKGVDGNGVIVCEKTSQMLHVSVHHLEWILNRDGYNPRSAGYDGTCGTVGENASIQFSFNSACGRFCTENGFVRGNMVECGGTDAYCFCVN